MFKKLKPFMFIFILFIGINIQAQNFNLKSNVPTDPSIKTGQLKNGLKYYIKKNSTPENRVELRLAINAGSMMENEDQQGLAHFTEHMCFNGTKNFPKNELVNFLEKTGVKFGAHLNAYTSFDETVYMLQLPTDDKETLQKGFQVLADWGHNVSFDNEEIDKERGVVIEEWRLGLGANERMRQKWFPVLLKDSRYAKRLPIGKLDILQNFKYQTIKDFYNDWYRPNLMAVIVVGDIDVTETEKTIKKLFGKMKNPKNAPKRNEYDIPNNKAPLVCIATDKEASYNMIMMYYKHKKQERKTLEAYRRNLVYHLYNGMINNRINEIRVTPESPFMYAYSYYSGFLGRTKNAYTSMAIPKENLISEALETIIGENEKVKRFGFTQTELDREKKELLSRYEKKAKESDKTKSADLANEYIRNFLEGNVIPSVVTENEYAKKFVPQITINEINKLAKKWITDDNLVLVITAKEGSKVPNEKEILEIIKSTKNKKYDAYVDKVSVAPLMTQKLKEVKAISKTENKKFGITELIFKNNVKVILKPTKFKNDEILFAAQAPGGLSIVPVKNILSAYYMSKVVNQSGIGDFNNISLKKKLAGNTASLYLRSEELLDEISGSASPKDFETLLKLNYQYFTNARKDEATFKTVISNMENQIKFMSASPQIYFYTNLAKITSSNNPRATYHTPSIEQIKLVTLDDVFDYYNNAFKNANDYTFFIVGNFDIEKITPLLEKYIGSLPTGNIKRNFVSNPIEFPEGITDVTLFKGSEPKSSVAINFNANFDWNKKDYIATKILQKALSIKLRESMREEQGGVYGVRANIDLTKLPNPEYYVSVMFGCSPENTDTLVETVFNEMKKLKKEGATLVDIDKAKKTLINEREAQLKENKFWLNNLKSSYFNNYELQSFDEYKKLINSINTDDTKKLANRFFNNKNYVKVILKPEK